MIQKICMLVSQINYNCPEHGNYPRLVTLCTEPCRKQAACPHPGVTLLSKMPQLWSTTLFIVRLATITHTIATAAHCKEDGPAAVISHHRRSRNHFHYYTTRIFTLAARVAIS